MKNASYIANTVAEIPPELDKLEHSRQPKQRNSIMATTFNTEVNEQIRADDDKMHHLVIAARPADLSDEDLDKVAGGIMPSPSAGGLGLSWLLCSITLK